MPTATETLMRERSAQHFINGRYQLGTGTALPIINPATEAVIGEYAEACEGEMQQAIRAATQAQKAWWALTAQSNAPTPCIGSRSCSLSKAPAWANA